MLSGQIDNLLVVRNLEYGPPIVAGQATGELFIDGTRVPFRMRVDFDWNTDLFGGFRESYSLELGPWLCHLSIWQYKSLLASLARAYWVACGSFANYNGDAADDADAPDEAKLLDFDDLEARWLSRHNFAILASDRKVVNEGGDALRVVVPDDFPGEAHGTGKLVVTSNRPIAFDCSEIPDGLSLRPAFASDTNTTIHGLIREIEARQWSSGFDGMWYEVAGEINLGDHLVPFSYRLATVPGDYVTADIEDWSLVFGESSTSISIAAGQSANGQDHDVIALGSCERDLPAWVYIEGAQALRAFVHAQLIDSGDLRPRDDDESVEYVDDSDGRWRFREPLPIVLRSDSARPSESPE